VLFARYIDDYILVYTMPSRTDEVVADCAIGVQWSHVDIAVNKETGGEALEEIVFKYKSFPTFQNTGHGTMQVTIIPIICSYSLM
jgi:hypothetical protein